MRSFLMLSLLMAFSVFGFAQTRTITGSVLDENGAGVPFASLTEKGTNRGVSADADGNFTINTSTGTVLVVTATGFGTTEVTVGAGTTLNVVVTRGEGQLIDEVVVTAAGLSARKRTIGTAQTTIRADNLVQAKPTNIVTGLTGKVAGMIVQGVGSGVNPNYRVVLRGMRSLTGNNQALIIVDNVISPSSILGNLNPDDIEDITVLNGAGGAALYGSAASNGAMIIKTKKGKATNGVEMTVEHTTTRETISFLPKMQQLFGSGADNDLQLYTAYENQQYGPRFDGQIREIGNPLQDGSIQKVPYSWNSQKGKNRFWQSGLTNQTSLSFASKADKSTFRASAQYLKSTGTVPFDEYNRAAARIGGERQLLSNLDVNYSAYYAQNRYNITNQTASIYERVLNSPGQIPLTDYRDYKNDPFSTPDGYFNAYYNNPYFMAGNYRQLTRNDYFMGNVELKFKPLTWLDFLGRVGLTTANQSNKNTTGVYIYSDFTKSWAGSSTYKQQDILGGVSDGFNYTTNMIGDFIAHARSEHRDLKIDYTVISQFIQNQYSGMSAAVNGLAVPDIYNLGNSTNNPTASQASYLARTIGLAGKVDFAFKDYLFLSVTGRNDWVSILDPANRSFFYPSANLSFVASDALDFLKNSNTLSFLKLRAGWSQVGQVNLGSSTNFGAYSLEPTFGQGSGYPYNGIGGHTVGNDLVQAGLKPEMTTGYELGFEAAFFKNRVALDVTYYDSETKDNVVNTGISSASGFSRFLTNSGVTSSKGLEIKANVVPIRTMDWEVSMGAVYSLYDNKVVSIPSTLERIQLGAYASGAGSYAVPGQPFPVIMGTTHVRDSLGRIIVDPITGYPSATSVISVLGPAFPTNTLGLNMTVSYKNLSFYASGEYRTGNYIYNSLASTFDFSGAGLNTIAYNRDRFVIPNSSYKDPVTGQYVANTNITVRDGGPGYWTIAGPRTGIHENYVTSAAFWKIREASLSYQLPKHLLGSQDVVKAVRVSLQGRNLFLWTPKTNVYTDPEYSDGNSASSGNAIGLTSLSQTPPSRYVGASLSLTF